MEYEFAGLPLHVLLVHVVVVGIPLVAALLVVVAAWPAARRVLWLPTAIAALAVLGTMYLTIEAGKWLEQRVPEAPLIQEHTAQGEDIVPWMIALTTIAALVAALAIVESVQRRRTAAAGQATTDAAAPRSRVARAVVAGLLTVAALGVGAGAVWTIVQIGEAGSRAVWEGSYSETPLD
jgi:hypothetical protein